MTHRPLVLLSLLGLAACNTTEPDVKPSPDTPAGIGLRRFADCSDLRAYLVDTWTENLVSNMYGYGRGGLAEDGAADGGSDGGGDDGGGNEAPSDWSETNTQEANVDEPDLVKTDGNFLYIAQQEELTIVKSWPADEAAVSGKVQIDGYPYQLFLEGDRALVYSYVYDVPAFTDRWGYGYGTQLTIVDVSDRENPAVVREVALQGWMSGARKVGTDTYTVVNTWQDFPYEIYDAIYNGEIELPEYDYEASEGEQELWRARARLILRPYVAAAVGALSDDELLPKMVDAPDVDGGTATPLLSCSDVYHTDDLSYPNMLSVVHLDLAAGDTGSDVAATGLMADGWTIYASEDNLYVSQTSWFWWWGWGDMDLTTRIHRFSLAGDDTVYETSGEVDGWLLNQFSMGEYDGHLRVATSDGWWGSEEVDPANNVFVLDTQDMALTGEVRGIAPNETIQSARFLGEKGYLVTFERIDPFFTLDLSDPTAPAVVGELKIPGFSTYLHPVSDDIVLSVGYAGTDTGEITGFAANMFDVSDFANPQLAHTWTVETDDWSWSEALWDHKAFTLHRGKLTLPLYTYDWDETTGDYSGFSGLVVLDAENALQEVGWVDHTDMVAASDCLWDAGRGPCDDYYWYASLRRSVIIEDKLFSISDYGVKVSELENPSDTITTVLFWPM